MLLNDVITGLSGGGVGGRGVVDKRGSAMRRYGQRGRKGEVKEGGVC